ncbi:MAG: DMT family transporter [Verrucomicrobiota bacterium]
MKPPKFSAIGWMLFSAVCFATMSALGHGLSKDLHWSVVAFARVGFNFVFVYLLAKATGTPLLYFSVPRNLWYRSIMGTLAIFAWLYTSLKLPVADALSILNTTPLWMALLIAFVTRQHVPNFIWYSVALGISGVFLVQQPHFNQGNLAALIGLFGAMCSAVAIYNLHLTKDLHPTTIVGHFSWFATISAMFLVAPQVPHLIQHPPFNLHVILLLLGVGLSGTIAQLAMTRAYIVGNPAINSNVGLAQVAFGAIIDILFWNRAFDLMTSIGIILIIIPTTLFVARNQLKLRKQPATAAEVAQPVD